MHAKLAEALDGLAKVMNAGLSPELARVILDNSHIYGTVYKRADLLKDMGKLANIEGFESLAKALKSASPQVKGIRFELEGAAQLIDNGAAIVQITKKVTANAAEQLAGTDIDVIVREGGSLIYYQFKRSAGALSSLPAVKLWVKKALLDLGPDANYSQIRYALPDNVMFISPTITQWFDEVGIVIERFSHLD
jgi:hypothetical protein